MTSGGAPPPAEHVGVISQSKQPSRSPTPNSGGEFLLQLLQNPPQNKPPPTATPSTSLPLDHHIPHHQHHHHDPAVAALGPSHPFPPWPGSPDFHTPEIRPWSNNHPYPPHLPPHAFPQFPWPLPGFPPPAAATINQFDPRNSHLPANHPAFGDDLQRLGFLHPPAPPAPALAPAGDFGSRPGRRDGHSVENTLRFGSIMFNVGDREGLPNGISSYDSLRRDDRKFLDVQPKIQLSRNSSTEKEVVVVSERSGSSKIQARKLVSEVNSHGSHSHNGNRARHEQGRRAPPAKQENRSGALEHRRPVGPLGKPKGGRQWVALNERQDEELGVEKEECRNSPNRSNHPSSPAHANNDFPLSESRRIQGNVSPQLHLGIQLDHPGPPTGSNLHSVPATDIVESLMHLQAEVVDKRYGLRDRREDKMNTARASGSANVRGNSQEPHMLREQLMDSLMVRDELTNKNAVRHDNGSHVKDFRLDFCRGLQAPGQRMRNHRRDIDCRSDIERLSHSFLSIYESLIPAEEEKAKQKQLLALLEKLVNKEWPGAQLYLYGSCASSFGVSTSDIDICLAIEDADINKPEILLKLAEILESDNLQNVQALTHARVPIVKLMDPLTGISCDICINNVLAVVNTKLLRDYAQIDVRLRQLAFIVKHWAKSRGVNETYQGTLSSYAYVIMCIHFLQRRRPAILPFLQEMEATYVVNVDDIECAFFDKVERLHDFGAQNKESIAQLLWAFFDYWAYRHDYANAVISVRTARIISKRAKDWTRRIGNDRHLICIEDPFEVSHDLGRVVDKHTIKILRAEFERAADIMQHDPNPSVTLFEPYVPR